MKKYIHIIIFMCLAFSLPSIQYADLAGRTYNKKIITIEKMLDGDIPMDIEFVRSNLELLRNRTVSSDRVERINNAYRRFKVFMDAENRKKTESKMQSDVVSPAPKHIMPVPQEPLQPRMQPEIKQALVPLPALEPTPVHPFAASSNTVSQEPVPNAMTPEQQLETLLLYTQSLASTVDVAIKVHQKNNAQTILAQAASQIPIMQNILMRYPQLTKRFRSRIESIAARIEKTQNEIDSMAK